MGPIDSITCVNKGAFVMKFHVKWQVGDGPVTPSPYSPEYPVEQSYKFELNIFDIPDGATVWAHYKIEAGKSKDCKPKLTFQRGVGAPAVYEISGTTLEPQSMLL